MAIGGGVGRAVAAKTIMSAAPGSARQAAGFGALMPHFPSFVSISTRLYNSIEECAEPDGLALIAA